eukprot:s1393_g4.t1
MAAVTQPLGAMQAELQRLQLLTNDIPTMKMDLELLRADLEALQSGLPPLDVEPLVRQILAQELRRPTNSNPAPLQSQSWSAYLGLGSDPPQGPAGQSAVSGNWQSVHKTTPFDSQEDSDSSNEAAFFGPPNAEPLQHIVHRDEAAEASAVRLLGLETVSFQKSIWDAAVIVTLHAGGGARKVVGNFNVVLSFCLLLVNIGIQCGLVLAVNSMADQDPLQSWIGVLRSQRLEDQAYERFDRKDLITRTQKLCGAKIHTEMQTTTEWLKEYLNEGHIFGKLPGQYICLLAMFVWILDIGIDLRRTLHDLALVVLSLPQTKSTRYDLRDGKYIITGVSFLQKVLALMVVILPRTLIAVFLMWFGLIYLAGTLNVDDLIVNVMALHFVLQVDEFLFEALVPRRMANMVNTMAIQVYVSQHHTLLPSELLRGRVGVSGCLPPESRRGLSLSIQSFYALFRVLYILAILLASWYYLLQPVQASARNAYEALCGHDTTFTYMLHPVTGTPLFAHVDRLEPGRHDREELRCFYAAQYEMVKMRAGFPSDLIPENDTLNAMIAGFHPACHFDPSSIGARACPEESLSYFERAKLVGEEGFYRNPQECRDQDVFFQVLRGVCSHPKFTQHSAGELDFFRETFSCNDLRNLCHFSTSHAISLP